MKDEDWIEAIGAASCSDCRFFVEQRRLTDDEETVLGECRNQPPVLLGKSDAGHWPVIEGGDWCGLFELSPSRRRAFETERRERWDRPSK